MSLRKIYMPCVVQKGAVIETGSVPPTLSVPVFVILYVNFLLYIVICRPVYLCHLHITDEGSRSVIGYNIIVKRKLIN